MMCHEPKQQINEKDDNRDCLVPPTKTPSWMDVLTMHVRDELLGASMHGCSASGGSAACAEYTQTRAQETQAASESLESSQDGKGKSRRDNRECMVKILRGSFASFSLLDLSCVAALCSPSKSPMPPCHRRRIRSIDRHGEPPRAQVAACRSPHGRNYSSSRTRSILLSIRLGLSGLRSWWMTGCHHMPMN